MMMTGCQCGQILCVGDQSSELVTRRWLTFCSSTLCTKKKNIHYILYLNKVPAKYIFFYIVHTVHVVIHCDCSTKILYV